MGQAGTEPAQGPQEWQPRARECIFGKGQDLGRSLAFYGEEAAWEGPSGQAFLLCHFSPGSARAEGERPDPQGTQGPTVPRPPGTGPDDGPPRSQPAEPRNVPLFLGHRAHLCKSPTGASELIRGSRTGVKRGCSGSCQDLDLTTLGVRHLWFPLFSLW